MPKTLEIIIGDVKKVSQELAERTVKEIEEARKNGRNYNIACAKGSSAVKYYEALKEIENGGFCFTNVKAFCIDEDLNATTGYDFARNNLPKGISVEGVRARFSYDGKAVDKDLLTPIIAANPLIYSHRGREIAIQPQNAIRSLSYGINKVCTGYEDKIASSGGIDTAVIGLGVDPLHIGSDFPPTKKESRTHLAEKADANGNIIGYAMTMGIATLCSAKKGVLFAQGEKKADGVKELLECDIDENCPPSYIRDMDNLIVALDQGAASRLDFDKLREIYKDRELKCQNSI
ncbi:6-phosphogluconolactonase [Candidatus Woesearchaeota archaeon]|nr:6-phosphogluconolactonase [Candidatus Woesearchaeota archaeon]